MSKIIFPFKKSRDSEVAKAGNRILSSVKGNANIPDNPLIQEFEKRLNEFQVSLNDAADGSKTMIAIKKEKRKALIEIMMLLGYYVLQVCNGDRAKLLSSGFDLAKENAEGKGLALIKTLEVTNAKPGEASILVKAVKGARAFVYQYSTEMPSAATTWVSETTSSRMHTFTGLRPLVTYWFRVVAVGRNGQSVILDPVSRTIL